MILSCFQLVPVARDEYSDDDETNDSVTSGSDLSSRDNSDEEEIENNVVTGTKFLNTQYQSSHLFDRPVTRKLTKTAKVKLIRVLLLSQEIRKAKLILLL